MTLLEWTADSLSHTRAFGRAPTRTIRHPGSATIVNCVAARLRRMHVCIMPATGTSSSLIEPTSSQDFVRRRCRGNGRLLREWRDGLVQASIAGLGAAPREDIATAARTQRERQLSAMLIHLRTPSQAFNSASWRF